MEVGQMTLISVGIDVSKGHSTVSARQWGDAILMKPCDIPHTASALGELADSLKSFSGEVRVVLEHTGRYWQPVAKVLFEAGLFVCAVNPKLLKDFGDNKLRQNNKTDKADSGKLSRYGLKYWTDLVPYVPTEVTRQKLKEFSRQLDTSNKLLTGLKNNLQAIVDVTFPGVRKIITSKARDDGHIKWVDFVCDFYHCAYVVKLGEVKFFERYRKWCKRRGYNFTAQSAAKIYAASQNQVPTLPYDADVKLLISQTAMQLTSVSTAVETWRLKVNELASSLPEYGCVMSMYGCGQTTGPQLMAEIGDITRFDGKMIDGKKISGKKTLVQFAGIAPGKIQSGDYEAKSVKTSKKGSSHLRKTLFQVISTYLKCSPADEPVYQFLDRKRAEGKPYYVYMTAGANKFLRIYYARIMEYLSTVGLSESE
jgi:transposase